MAIRPDWTVGTLNLSSGSKDFTTTGAAMVSAAVQAGDEIITAGGDILIIESITSDNAGTLYQPCPAGSAGIEQPLRIRFQPDGSRYSAAARELVHQLGSGNVYAFSQLLGDVDKLPYFTAPGAMGLIDLASLAGGGSGGWDALVGTLAGRDAYNGEPAGFRVMVADNGNGQAVIYEKTVTGWSVPVPFTGPRGNDGQPNTLSVGTVSEGAQVHVSITGTAPNQIVNFVLQRGDDGEPGPMGDVTPAALAAKAAAEAAAAQAALDAQATGEDRTAVAADKVATTADRQATASDRVATGQDKAATAADRLATGQDKAATNADAVATAADKTAAAQSATIASTKASEAAASAIATAADRTATGQDRVATAADRVATGQDKTAANQSAVNAAASESSVAADALSAANSAAGALASKQDAQAAAMVSDDRATVATTAADTATTQAGIATSAATQTAADRTAVGNDKTAVAADRLAAQAASSVAVSARDRAEEWSNAPEGQEIEPGEYSAFHWSKVAETAAGGGVQMVNGKTGASITLDAADVGAATAAQGVKADSALQTLTAGSNITISGTGDGRTISATSAPQVQSDWNAASGIAAILNKPSLGTAAAANVGDFATAAQGVKADSAVQPSITITAGTGLTGGGTLAANRTLALNSTSIASLAAADTALQTLVAGSNVTITGTGTSRTINATSASQVQTDWNATSGLGVLLNKPTLGTAASQPATAFATSAQGGKADTALQSLTQGANITITGTGTSRTIAATVPAAPVTSVNTKTGAVVLSAADVGAATTAQGTKADSAVQPAGLTKAAVGLGSVDNTSDASKPVSTPQQNALNLKVSNSRITISAASPTGGVNGDLWFKL